MTKFFTSVNRRLVRRVFPHFFSEAPKCAKQDELIDYSIRSGAPLEVVENLQELEDEGADVYETIEDIWPDYPTQEDFLFNEDEY